MAMKSRALTCWLAAALVASAACTSSGPKRDEPAAREGPVIRVASFEFPESKAVAEFYASALREGRFSVSVIDALGSREIVEPALEQDVVDFVPEYSGTALQFLTGSQVGQRADPASVHQRLRAAFAARGVAVLAAAPAQDQNAIVVSTATARKNGLRTVSDLVRIADGLIFGGPPECPARPLCLPGLQAAYGLRFKTFEPMANRAVTVEALESGEIDVGLLESSDPRLTTGRLTLLADDRGLQPPEHIVPVVRKEIVDAYGARFVALVDAVSAKLTNERLVDLNRKAMETQAG
jgi:osmoprotectant transport system substrate-binding protein